MTAITKAILTVMEQVPYLQKQRGPGLNYSYAGEAALLEKLHPAMLLAGLTFRPVAMTVLHNGEYKTAHGKLMNHAIISATYELRHVSGESLQVTALGEASDTGDKATLKAMTAALKYALRQTFLIETGDDPDVQPSNNGNERVEQPAPAPAPAQPIGPNIDKFDEWARFISQEPLLDAFNLRIQSTLGELDTVTKSAVWKVILHYAHSNGWTLPKGARAFVPTTEFTPETVSY